MKIATTKHTRLFKNFFLDALATAVAVTISMKWYELKKIERHVPIWELFLIILAVYIAIMLLFLALFGHTFGY
jgi:hypothetical protein